jgi:hypothetical protein
MESKIKKASISFRIGTEQWMPEKRFQELLNLFEKYEGVTDGITFFTSETHPPLPLEVIRERADLLAKRMSAVRKMGYQTGINILATIGHHNENLPHSLSGEYTPMTDIEGHVCLGSFCPNDEPMRGYVRQLYEIIASADPDYIWIDDDVRLLGHLPIKETCFCDNCLRIFEQEYGVKYTRTSLEAAFSSGPVEKKLQVRRTWLQHNRNTVARLLELIEKIVHGLKPGMPLGFMTGERFFEGYDFDKWAEILSGSGRAEVRWRPGGGFYADDCMKGLIGKSHAIGRQASLLPDGVVSIQSEIENFPYQRLRKAAHTTAIEAASHIAAGCTGAAFNVLSMYDEPLGEYEPLMSTLCRTRPFFDLLVHELGRAKPKGIYTGWNKDHDQWFDVELLGMLTLLDLLLFTRNRELIKAKWPAIRLFEEYLRSRCDRHDCVLVGVQGSQLEFAQGQPRYVTATQFYARSFYLKAAEVARYIGREKAAEDFENRASVFEKSIEAFRDAHGWYIGGRGEDWRTLYGTGRLDGSRSSYFEPYPNSVPAILGLFGGKEARHLARRFFEIPEMTKNVLVPFNWPERPLEEFDDDGAFPAPGCHVNGGAFWMTTAALAALAVRAADIEGYAWMEGLLPLHDARRTIDYYNQWGEHIENQWPEKQRPDMFSITELGTYGWPLRALLGIEPRHNGLFLDPVLPPDVHRLSFEAPVYFGSCRINIALNRKDALSNYICRLTVQGDEIPVGEGTGVLIPEELLEFQTAVDIEVEANQ